MSETMNTGVRPETDGTATALAGREAGIIAAVEAELQRIKKDAEAESARIIAEAKQLAQTINSQAEEKANQEAREKTRQEVERIAVAAKDESAAILAEARQEAQRQSGTILADAKQAAETTARTLLEEARKAADDAGRSASELKQKAEREAAETRDRALHEAERIAKDAVDRARTRVAERADSILAEARNEGERIVAQASDAASGMLQEAASAVHEAVQKLAGRMQQTREKSPEQSGHEDKPGPQSGVGREDLPSVERQSGPVAAPVYDSSPSPALAQERPQAVDLLAVSGAEAAGQSCAEAQVGPVPLSIEQLLGRDAAPDGGDDAVLYIGDVELYIAAPTDVDRLREFVEDLKKVDHLQIQRSECEASGGVKVTAVVDAALRLFEIVRRLPQVEEAAQIGKDILITLLPARKGTEKRAAGSPDNGPERDAPQRAVEE